METSYQSLFHSVKVLHLICKLIKAKSIDRFEKVSIPVGFTIAEQKILKT